VNELPRIALIKEATRPEVYLAVNGVKLWIESIDDFNALGLNLTKVRVVPRAVVEKLPAEPFSLPPTVKPSDVHIGSNVDAGQKDVRSLIGRDILVAGWLLQPQGTRSVNGGIAGNMGNGWGVEDIVYDNLLLDIGFLEAMYGWEGLSSNLRPAMLPGNPLPPGVRLPFLDGFIVNSFSLPGDDRPPQHLEIHVELNCWHEETRLGNWRTVVERYKIEGMGPHPDGWVQQWWHSDFTDCWWPFPPLNPDARERDLEQGDYVLVRGALWQDGAHGSEPLWNSGRTRGQAGWLEIHPVDYMRRIPAPGLAKSGATESYAGGEGRVESHELPPESASGVPLQVAAHESWMDGRFSGAAFAVPTVTDLGDRVRIDSPVNSSGADIRFKAGHLITWGLPAPAVCSSDPAADRLDVFARGRDDACWYRRLDPARGGWQPWETLGGVLTSDPAATALTSGVPAVVVRGTDGALYWQWYRAAGDQSGWQPISDAVPGEPAKPLTGAVRPERLRERG
jgi:hypothetical protein